MPCSWELRFQQDAVTDRTGFLHWDNRINNDNRTNRSAINEADILTIWRGNSILVLSCSFKVSKYISECCSHRNFLWALANTFFADITIKLYYCQKR